MRAFTALGTVQCGSQSPRPAVLTDALHTEHGARALESNDGKYIYLLQK